MISLLEQARDAKHVAVFTIHEPPNPPADRIDRAEALVFLPDGFSYSAALFAPFWLAAHRLWLALAIYVAVAGALAAVLSALGIDSTWVAVAVMALNFWLGFEASEIQRRALSANGWSEAGSVSGRDLAECERRFFDNWLSGQPILARLNTDDGSLHPASNLPSVSIPAAKTAGQGLLGRLFSAGA